MVRVTAPNENDREEMLDERNKNSRCFSKCPDTIQTHVHEYEGSTRIAEKKEDPHNHRFAGVTGQAIPYGNSHYHKLQGNSDFYENHFHEVGARTGLAIPVGEGRHVHFVSGQTTCNDGHNHEFIFATLIDNPIGD